MNQHSNHPDTRESGEAYDVERHSDPLESSVEEASQPESLLKPTGSRARSAMCT
jgi:hypothetical protein